MVTDRPAGGPSANARSAGAVHEPRETGDVDALDDSPHRRWVNHPRTSRDGPGPEGVKGTIPSLRSVLPDREIAIEAGNTVIVRSLGTGTEQAEFPGVSPAGQRGADRAREIRRCAEGRSVESPDAQDS